MQASRAAEAEEAKESRVMPSPNRDQSQSSFHISVGHANHAERGLFAPDGSRGGLRHFESQLIQYLRRAGVVELHLVAQQPGAREAPQNKIGVGHGRARSESVTGRSRI